jgi:hypothetical protein
MGSPDNAASHHLSLINSIILVVFLMFVATWILVKALKNDIAVYSAIDIYMGDDDEDEVDKKDGRSSSSVSSLV